MNHEFRRLSIPSILAASLLLANPLGADQRQLDEAVKRYYAGYPRDAIEMLGPLGDSGDVEAQYLLGNIYYSLSKAGVFDSDDKAIEWYRRAAEQQSADASYALAVIYDNRWRHSGNKQDAAKAIVYYRRAINLGHIQATSPLARLRNRSGLSDEAAIALSDVPGDVTTARPVTPAPEVSTTKNTDEDVQTASANIANESAQSTRVGNAAQPAKNSEPTAAPLAEQDRDNVPGVSLAQVADRCEQYTRAGFDLYADSLEGARLSGRALVVSVESDAATPETYTVRFSDNRQDAPLLLDLRKVPRTIASRYQKGKPATLSGIVVRSEPSTSGCSIRLEFRPPSG